METPPQQPSETPQPTDPSASTSEPIPAIGDAPRPQPSAPGEASTAPPPATTAATAESNKTKIVEEFQYLLEKSQQLFAGLRDLPPTGSNKQWQPYFQRTFELYTKLWKFQQQYRHILEDKELYGLKRWEIGEIASKIGQLYYHYYLRTSETNYLLESFIFYDAIRERAYFKDVVESKNSALMIKKLRYFARFIVVCLLLNKMVLVRKLIDELNFHVDEYTRVYKAQDAPDWIVVVDEIVKFIDAERKDIPLVLDGDKWPIDSRIGKPVIPSTLSGSGAETDSSVAGLVVEQAVLVGSSAGQIKFSELTLDVFRILQSFERDPSLEKPSTNGEKSKDGKGKTPRPNPHKYLLFRPTLPQLLVYLSSAFRELSENGAMVVYLSADGFNPDLGQPEPKNSVVDAFNGGLMMNSKQSEVSLGEPAKIVSTAVNCVYPGDLLTYTRKPLLLIVESSNSYAFKNFAQIFNQPVVCLLSPIKLPDAFKDISSSGCLFTLFLYSPVLGFLKLRRISNVALETWTKLKAAMQELETSVYYLFLGTAGVDKAYKRFLQDDFSRRILTRFLLTQMLMATIVEFKDAALYQPSSSPPLPASMATGDKEVQDKMRAFMDLLLPLNQPPLQQ